MDFLHCIRDHATVYVTLGAVRGGEVDFVMKRYENYGEGSQVRLLCNASKKFHMAHLSAVVTFCTLQFEKIH